MDANSNNKIIQDEEQFERENENRTGHAIKIPLKAINKISKSICQISYGDNNSQSYGSGFFMLVNGLKCLLTNYHVIPKNIIFGVIDIQIYNNKKINIKLDDNDRYIQYFQDIDITIIEIKESDNILLDIDFLDYDLNYLSGYEQYKNIDIFTLQYPNDDIEVASGKIIEILNNFEFKHTIDTENGSSGSPIIIPNILKVVGIHKQGDKRNIKVNYGSFIGEIFKKNLLNKIEIKNDNNLKSINDELDKNYIVGEINISKDDIGKNIRIINSYEEFCSENKLNIDPKYKNEKDIKKCIIEINDVKYPFSYFHKFNSMEKYKIKYNFINNLTNCMYMFANTPYITKLNFCQFNMQSIKDMNYIFGDFSSHKDKLEKSYEDGKLIPKMREMFCEIDGMLSESYYLCNYKLNNFREKKTNNIIYFFSKQENNNREMENVFDLVEKEINCTFIFCTNLKSLEIIKSEIIKQKKRDKRTFFNIISTGREYELYLKEFLNKNLNFKNSINKICIFCKDTTNYLKYKDEEKGLIHDITTDYPDIVGFIIKFSSNEIHQFHTTKLITLQDYINNNYKELHRKIAEFYGDLTKEGYRENMKKIKVDENYYNDELSKIIFDDSITFDINQDLKTLINLILNYYKKDTFYGDLNKWYTSKLRTYICYYTSRFIYIFNQYANKNNKYAIKNNKVFYRGIKLPYSSLLQYERAVDKIIIFPSFISTSEDEKIADNFSSRKNAKMLFEVNGLFSVKFHIKNIYNNNWISNGIDISELNAYYEEKEIIFLPFSFFKVTKVDLDEINYTADIFLETIGKKEILEDKIKYGKRIKYNEKENIIEIE